MTIIFKIYSLNTFLNERYKAVIRMYGMGHCTVF
jgi:hypothetical protein